MLDELTIKGIRGIEYLRLDNLSLVNVIAGDNGSGKTTILESAVLLLSGSLVELRRAQNSRGLPLVPSNRFTPKNLNESFFPGFADLGEGLIEGQRFGRRWQTRLYTAHIIVVEDDEDEETLEIEEDDEDVVLRIQTTVDGQPVPNERTGQELVRSRMLTTTDRRPVREDVTTLGDIRLSPDRRSLREIVEALKTIRPDIEDVEYIESSSGTGFYVTLSQGLRVPLGVLGGGANALFRYLLALQRVAGGILAIDEVEGGFHYSRVETVFKALLAAARITKTQIFCTTHSKEVLTALAQAAAETPENDLSVISAYRDQNGRVAAQVFRESDALASLKYGYELR